MIFALVFAFIIVVLIDYKTIVRTKQPFKTSVAYIVILIAGFTISLLLVMGKAPQSPAIIIEKIIKSFT